MASRAPLGAAWPAPVRLPLCLDAGLAAAPMIHVGRPGAVLERRVVRWPISGSASSKPAVAVRVSCAADVTAAAMVGVARRAVFGRHALSVKSEFRGIVGRSTRGIGNPAAAGPRLCLRRLGVTNSMPRDGAKSGTESDKAALASIGPYGPGGSTRLGLASGARATNRWGITMRSVAASTAGVVLVLGGMAGPAHADAPVDPVEHYSGSFANDSTECGLDLHFK